MQKLKVIWYNKECEKLTTPGAVSYNLLKHINTPLKAKNWKVNDLYPELDERVALERMANFFNGISKEFVGLKKEDIPTTYDSADEIISPGQVIERVKTIKRPKSMVPGDIPPKLVPAVIEKLAEPLADIYNCALTYGWPEQWKLEYQTIIPKKPLLPLSMTVEILAALISSVRSSRASSSKDC